jgi:exopolysaccharide biosynthesis polyprenyl glycosylphosphotransferase
MDAYQSGLDIIRRLSWRFVLVAEVSAIGAEEDIYKMIQEAGVEAVMLCGLASSQRNDILKYCITHEIRAYVRPNIGDFIMSSAKTIQMANLPVIVCEHSAPSLFYLVIKRTMDIVLSLCGLVMAGPVMILTAIAVKAYDHGPVLYKQARMTKAGRTFYIYKFRSMQVNAEQDGIARLAQQNDQRITAVGKIIRACRIDELPQMLNILGGSMSVVGPRPERPEIFEQYQETLPEFGLRLQVKAGLTGYAQVYGKYNTMPYDKLQMDLMYIAHPSIIEDLKIILATIKVLFVSESTEGIEEHKVIALSMHNLEIDDMVQAAEKNKAFTKARQ